MSFSDIGEYHSRAIPPSIRKPRMRSKGKTSPNVTITDEIGYIYETDETGEYKRTTGLIQKLETRTINSFILMELDSTTLFAKAPDENLCLSGCRGMKL